jgi:hypothetical protein
MLAFFAACAWLPAPVEPTCEDPRAFYPDADGDGLGEPTQVFVGCVPPEGWVTAFDSAFVGDSVAPGDTGTPTSGP